MTDWYQKVLSMARQRLGEDRAHLWVQSPNRRLDGMRPAELCGDEYGARIVLAALAQPADAGVC